MKVFISWSGNTSKLVGEAIRDWLPSVLQTVQPYFTPSDLEKGTRWSTDIAVELDNSKVGIFCVTRDNLDSKWLMFEAGAISKKVDQSLVCPVLIGIDNSDVSGPLTQFQTTLFNKSDFKKLVASINTANEDNRLDAQVFTTVFEKFWPDLELKVNSILKSEAEGAPKSLIRSDRNILEEILDLSRSLAIEKRGGFRRLDEYNQLVLDFVETFNLVFENDWDFTKDLIDSTSFISEHGSFIDPRVEDESNNWANRGALLHAYRKLVEFINTHEKLESFHPYPNFLSLP